MKPRAKKFRIRRSTPTEGARGRAGAATAAERLSQPIGDEDDGLGPGLSRPQGSAAQAVEAEALPNLTPEQELEAIRAEGLTGRQLRLARRIAQKHGLDPVSDLDAVRLLRRRGIDPFERENMLELVVAGAEKQAAPQLPATLRQPAPGLPSTHVAPPAGAEERAAGIREIQRDIARRRRRRLALLAVRLICFVFVPTLLAAFYYFRVATPMYATNTEFVIQQADGGAGGSLGGLFSGTTFATTQDSITVQSYLQSREAMLRLDRDHGFKAHFQAPEVDPIQRLESDATNEAAYRLYRRHVKIGYDPTEGIVKMEVIAASPEASAAFSRALIAYAEEQVDALTQRLRGDQMQGARDSFEDAEAKMMAAQRRVIDLQEQRGVLSAELEVSSRMGQINTFEVELKNRRLELEELLSNERPNAARVAVAERQIDRLERLISDMRAEMTGGGQDTASLARISGELVIAEAELQTRQLMLN